MIEIGTNVLYREQELVEGLGCSTSWLRRRVPRTTSPGDERAYLGGDVLAQMRPAKAASRESVPSIYFIRCCDAIKIGFSTDVKSRLDSLQVCNPHPLKLLASVPGTRGDEAELHERFAPLRIRGEWFAADAELLYFVAELSH